MLAAFGAQDWKPVLAALLLPPVSLLLLLLAGLGLRAGRRPIIGLVLVLVSLLGLWFAHCRVTADWMERRWIKPPPVLLPDHLTALKREMSGRKAAVLVLGGGRDAFAPEYGEPMLADRSLQRLHYGLWLARRMDLPVMVSGGVGHAQFKDVAEASVAARIAERDFGRSIRWQEGQSADTRGNARLSVPMLANQGVTDIVLVTHRWHMPRAMRAFEEAVALGGAKIRVTAAPMGAASSGDLQVLDWLPSAEGFTRVHENLREVLAWIAGA